MSFLIWLGIFSVVLRSTKIPFLQTVIEVTNYWQLASIRFHHKSPCVSAGFPYLRNSSNAVLIIGGIISRYFSLRGSLLNAVRVSYFVNASLMQVGIAASCRRDRS